MGNKPTRQRSSQSQRRKSTAPNLRPRTDSKSHFRSIHSGKYNIKRLSTTPRLITACEGGNYTRVETIIDCGDDINVQNTNGTTPLITACVSGNVELVELMLNHGAEVNMKDNNGWSSLMIASQHGHKEVVKTLLNKGAEINMINNYGSSSLMLASQTGHSDVVQVLLDKGAAMNMRNNYGSSCLLLASQNGQDNVVKTLLNTGADVNVQMNDGSTSLMLASQKGHINVVKRLLDKGAEINMQNNDGWSSLMIASRTGHNDVVRTLLDKGAEVNTQKSYGWCALMFASLHGHSNTVRILLDNHADITIQNKSGDTARDIANKKGYKNISKVLVVAEQCKNYSPLPRQALLLHSTLLEQTKATATSSDIGISIGIDPKKLDQPCTEDLLFTIARLLPNWLEYADPLKMSPQEINGIGTDLDLTYAMKSYQLLKMWYRKNAYTERCHYRVLVEASCALGYADVAGEICKLIKENPLPIIEDSSIEQISKELILFKEEGIGGGAYGAVFKGEMNGQPCAIKVLYPLANQIRTGLPTAKQTKQDILDRFRQECEYLETFKHPNVVRHLATKTHPKTGLPVLALELMDCNLRQFFSSPSSKDLPFLTQKSLCRDIASALAYIHSRHFIHRDLCSDNILLVCKEENPVAKVCDFGMSKIIKSEGTSISLPAFGHRGYLPPEATDVDSSRFDSSFDIFAFGALMVQIVCCLPTIKSRKERTHELDQLDSAHPLKSIIELCLLVNRDDRPSAIQLERKLT